MGVKLPGGVDDVLNGFMKGVKEGMSKSYLNKGSLNGTVKMVKGNDGVDLGGFIGKLEKAAANPSKFGGEAADKSMQAMRETLKKEITPQLSRSGKLGKDVELGSGMKRILSSDDNARKLFKELGYEFDSVKGAKSLIQTDGGLAQNAGAFYGNGLYNSVKNFQQIAKNERNYGTVKKAIKDAHSTNGELDAMKVAGTAATAFTAKKVADRRR